MPIIFDGLQLAALKEQQLSLDVFNLKKRGIHLKIAAILFQEDAGSVTYTRLKKEAATRVGIGYSTYVFSICDPVKKILSQITDCNQDKSVTGIIIQKPMKRRWQEVVSQQSLPQEDYSKWWSSLVGAIDLKKDVDGLHPQTLESVKNGTWQIEGKVLPATCQAVLEILESCKQQLPGSFSLKSKIIINGKSDLLGTPLTYVLKNKGYSVELLGHQDFKLRLESQQQLRDADILITATGQASLITGELVKPGVVAIDVGEPKGDLDQSTVLPNSVFFTPVPGGVGPMTVVSLLANAVLISSS